MHLSLYTSGSQPGVPPAGDAWQCLQILLVITLAGVSSWYPEGQGQGCCLHSTPHKKASTTKKDLVQMAAIPRLRMAGLDMHGVHVCLRPYSRACPVPATL